MRGPSLGIGAAVAALSACFDPALPADLQCEESRRCPAGLVCAPDNVCRPPGAASDASGPHPDADAALPGADAALGDWSEPVPLDALNDPDRDEDDPSLTADLLEIYFNRGTDTSSDIYVSTRSSVSGPWSEPEPVAELNSAAYDTTPELSADALTIYFASNRASMFFDIWVSTRPDRESPWSPPTRVDELSSPAEDFAATPAAGQLRLLLDSNRSGGDYDLYGSSRASTDEPWGAPSRLPVVNSSADDGHAHLTETGVLYFDSYRDGGDRDLYRAEPDGERFAAPEPIEELNTPNNEGDPWVSRDRRLIVFTVEDADGNGDLVQATR